MRGTHRNTADSKRRCSQLSSCVGSLPSPTPMAQRSISASRGLPAICNARGAVLHQRLAWAPCRLRHSRRSAPPAPRGGSLPSPTLTAQGSTSASGSPLLCCSFCLAPRLPTHSCPLQRTWPTQVKHFILWPHEDPTKHSVVASIFHSPSVIMASSYLDMD